MKKIGAPFGTAGVELSKFTLCTHNCHRVMHVNFECMYSTLDSGVVN